MNQSGLLINLVPRHRDLGRGGASSSRGLSSWIPIFMTGAVIVVFVGWLCRAPRSAVEASRERSRSDPPARARSRRRRQARPPREILELQKPDPAGHRGAQGEQARRQKRGAAPSTSLPWYVIVGPPGRRQDDGAQALGPRLPLPRPASGGGVRGVGGTRNCDWWFTNEGHPPRHGRPLHDRGRRPRRVDRLPRLPAQVPPAEADQRRDRRGQRQRTRCRPPRTRSSPARRSAQRIDEMMTRLKMVVPVYVLFTKMDLMAGFVEFFGRPQEERARAGLGRHLPARREKRRAGASLRRASSTPRADAPPRALKRIGAASAARGGERSTSSRSSSRSLRAQPLGLPQAAVAPAAQRLPGDPHPPRRLLHERHQEGSPIDRVVGAMRRAFGIRRRPSRGRRVAQSESKSYFVTDLFRKVVFPDQATRGGPRPSSAAVDQSRRGRGHRMPSWRPFSSCPPRAPIARNRGLIDADGRHDGRGGQGAMGTSDHPPTDKVKRARRPPHAARTARHVEAGGARPVGYRWGMYTGNDLYEPLRVGVRRQPPGRLRAANEARLEQEPGPAGRCRP